MIKTVVVSVFSAVIAIGIYEKYILGLERQERNAESSYLLEEVTNRIMEVKHSIPHVENEEDLKSLLDSVGGQAEMLFHTTKEKVEELSAEHNPRPYR